MGIFSKLQNIFASKSEDTSAQHENINLSEAQQEDILHAMRATQQDIHSWVGVLVEYAPLTNGLLYATLLYMLEILGCPEPKRIECVDILRSWVSEMGYTNTADIQSELEYRLHILLGIEEKIEVRSSFFDVITKGLSKTRALFTQQIHRLLSDTEELNEEFWENVERIFLTADMGYNATEYVIQELRVRITKKEEFLGSLEKIIESIFMCERRLVLHTKPTVHMVIGVNGAGKTTTVAKLAHIYKQEGKRVLIIAADTFRAAAIEQLEIWSTRLDVGFFAKAHGSDAASVAFEGIRKAQEENYDIVLIDTAGRLHTKSNLMEELSKVYRVIKKCIPEAPHAVILVLDATIGQNALAQTELFNKACPIDEVIITKLDGTAKGGIAIGVALQYALPISYIGLGESMDALQPFDALQFTKALLE